VGKAIFRTTEYFVALQTKVAISGAVCPRPLEHFVRSLYPLLSSFLQNAEMPEVFSQADEAELVIITV
jgi:hypothetical protein